MIPPAPLGPTCMYSTTLATLQQQYISKCFWTHCINTIGYLKTPLHTRDVCRCSEVSIKISRGVYRCTCLNWNTFRFSSYMHCTPSVKLDTVRYFWSHLQICHTSGHLQTHLNVTNSRHLDLKSKGIWTCLQVSGRRSLDMTSTHLHNYHCINIDQLLHSCKLYSAQCTLKLLCYIKLHLSEELFLQK